MQPTSDCDEQEGAEIEPYKPQEEENDHGDDENEKQNNPRNDIDAPPVLSGQEGGMGHSRAAGGVGDPSGMPFFSRFPLTDVSGTNSTEELTSFFQEPQPPPPDPQQDDGGGNSMAQQQRPAPALEQMQVAATSNSTLRNDSLRAMSSIETIYDENDEHEDTKEDEKKLSLEKKNAKKKRRSLPTDITGTGDVDAVDKTEYKDVPLPVSGASSAAPSDEGSRAVSSGAHPSSGRNHKHDYEDDEAMEEEDRIRKVIRDLKEIDAMFGIDEMDLESSESDWSAEDADIEQKCQRQQDHSN